MEMDTQNEMREGTLIFMRPGLSIRLSDGTEHAVAEDDYIECLFHFNSESHTFDQYCPLNQQYVDGLWYYDTIGRTVTNNGLPVRFRKARAGERVKTGTLTCKKNKLEIELWAGGTREIENGTWLELNLLHDRERYDAGKTTRLTWQRSRVEFDATTKKWIYFDIYEHAYPLEDDQLARITY